MRFYLVQYLSQYIYLPAKLFFLLRSLFFLVFWGPLWFCIWRGVKIDLLSKLAMCSRLYMFLVEEHLVLFLVYWHLTVDWILFLFYWTDSRKNRGMVGWLILGLYSDKFSKEFVRLFLFFDQIRHHFEQQELIICFGFVDLERFEVLPSCLLSKHLKITNLDILQIL